MAESEKKKKKNSGCLGCLGILGVISLTAGIYLLNQWDTSGTAVRAGSVALVTVGVLMMLPALIAIAILVVVYLFLRKLGKSVEGLDEKLDEDAAEEMVEQNRKMYSQIHTFRPATEEDFEDLDVGWYASTTASLEGMGFRKLGDIVDETIEETNGMVTPIRVFTSMDGTTGVAIYHFAPSLGGGETKLLMVDVATEFNDGVFVLTSNTGDHDKTTSPPKLVRRKLPLETSMEQLLAAHVAERSLYAVGNPQVMPVAINTLEEMLESEKRQQKVKNEFREGIGFVDPEEVRRISDGQDIPSPALDRIVDSVREAAERAKRGKPDDESKGGGV